MQGTATPNFFKKSRPGEKNASPAQNQRTNAETIIGQSAQPAGVITLRKLLRKQVGKADQYCYLVSAGTGRNEAMLVPDLHRQAVECAIEAGRNGNS